MIDRQRRAPRRLWFTPAWRALVVGLCAVSLLNSCSSDDTALTVFAAASLTDALDDVIVEYSAAGGSPVRVSYAGSSTLAAQIIDGAPADVFISANPEQMDAVTTVIDGHGAPVTIARNSLVIAVERDNPLGITGLADLERPDLLIAIAAPEVPAGDYARRALDAAGVVITPTTFETDVRAVVTRVALGEVDAGIVYASDIAGRDTTDDDTAAVTAVPLGHPDAARITAEYPAVALDATNAAAVDFIAFLGGPVATAALTARGFSSP
ncbi:MAG: molybdate ABC transporter substrate-binding protein [Ilumatobacteraceae bacterium]